jgi:GNAT superfamily N-acetyltransferase
MTRLAEFGQQPSLAADGFGAARFDSHNPTNRMSSNHKMPDLEAIVALDLMTLREHTERAGDILDAATHRQSLKKLLAASEVIEVRREDILIAYAMLCPQEEGRWFVLGFNTHPLHRDGSVFRALFAQLAQLAQRRSITSLRSNVYRTNRLSMAFHRRLGFKVTRENSKGVEFTADMRDLISASPALRRIKSG